MLLDYINSALDKATYDKLNDDNSFYGEIPGFEGVYANAVTLEQCRNELRETLEEWILIRVSKNLSLPEINGKNLRISKVA
ncbi:MAG: type II toxin-antitoxin system HicB family antitoxin [Ignavibacteriales bacterium]|nr:MAG: type II toxin-antitoxin system HicB family antitoxin [Ignavibacteriales bacterium]